jgi:hypothetical protein
MTTEICCDLLRELLRFGALLLELFARALAGRGVRHGKLRGRARRLLRAARVQSRQLERVVLDVAALSADEVPASHVVRVAVVVVVLAVARDLLRIRPEVRLESDVRGVDAAVDYGDDDRALRLLACEQLTLALRALTPTTRSDDTSSSCQSRGASAGRAGGSR